MNLYIKIENNQPINHPALEDNLILAFGSVPENWEPFVRVARPVPGLYQVLVSEEPVYAKVDGVWKDVWTLRDMTAEEKTAAQQVVLTAFNDREYVENWSAWTFNEDLCAMVPPFERPARNPTKLGLGIMTFWCGADNNWKDTPKKPFDEKQYKFNFLTWQWVEEEVVNLD